MRLSTNEIVWRAKKFAQSWANASYEKGETQTFYNEFFEIFDVKRRQVARYEEHVKKLDNRTGFIDLFWPGTFLVEQKSAGRNLEAARLQAGDYFDAIKDSEKPRYQLLSDFQTFDLLDRDTRESWSFPLADLHKHIERFNFIRGIQTRKFVDQDPANIKASEIMGALHDALEETGYKGHDLEQYLVRLLFVLFADDTGIFEPRDILLDLIESRTRPDGSDTGLWLHQLFEVLDTPDEERQSTLDADLAQFPYINGDLFKGPLRTASFTSKMRTQLLEACRFNWSAVSPAIFGSLFQSVMDGTERRKAGAHYTTEKNIMKVIGPLFLDDLRAEFERLKARKDGRRRGELEAFRRRLATLTFLDPACGCGNFLIIAYRELRQLELEVLKEVNPAGQRVLNAAILSDVDVDQFFGIEFGEFPARIAEVAMWMMDHIMNNRLSEEFGQTFLRIPLRKSAHIRHADALEIDWNSVLPADQCSHVLGNPPFVGAKYQSAKQRQQVRDIARLGGSGGTLDYVAAWFVKAAAYVQDGRGNIGFVATNSITQGEQVAQLWPILFDRFRLEIAFAHRTFGWGSEARGKAHVHVVIIGLVKAGTALAAKYIYEYTKLNGDPQRHTVRSINPYLLEGGNLIVDGRSSPLAVAPRMVNGSVPADGGNFILSEAQRQELVAKEPGAANYIRPYVGAQDLIQGLTRYCLWLRDCPPNVLRTLPLVREHVRRVRQMREASIKLATRTKAGTPTLFTEDRQPSSGTYLAVPRTSSERREYLPVGFLPSATIAANDLQIVPGAALGGFGLVASAMHMAWTRITSGRLKSDIRYSARYTYNTFPWPQLTAAQAQNIAALAQAVLDARAAFPGSSLADLYDPDLMPPVLRKAHRDLDLAVDRLYRKAPFGSERERVEHLFMLYEKMVAPLQAAMAAKAKRRRGPRQKHFPPGTGGSTEPQGERDGE